MSFQLEVGPLDEETKKLAEVELRETPENVKNGIANLRKLLEGKLFNNYNFIICFFLFCNNFI